MPMNDFVPVRIRPLQLTRCSRLCHRCEMECPAIWDHPLEQVRDYVDAALGRFAAELEAWERRAAPLPITPVLFLKAHLLLSLYPFESDHAFCASLQTNEPFRRFLGLQGESAPFDTACFSRMRRRLRKDPAVLTFYDALLADASVLLKTP